MDHDKLPRADISDSLSGAAPELLNCLLLIRYLALDAERHPDAARLWRTIAAEARKPDSCLFPIIKDAADRLRSELPFKPELPRCLIGPDECTLRALVRQLEHVPADACLPAAAQNPHSGYGPAPCPGDFYTPGQIVQWLTELLPLDRGGSLYDPCCGSGAMLYGAALSGSGKKLRLYGQAPDPGSFFACRMNLTLRGMCAEFGPRPANALLEDLYPGTRFDYILANPPFNFPHPDESSREQSGPRQSRHLPQRSAGFAWLRHILDHLAPDGQAITLLPNGTLTAQTAEGRILRRQLLAAGWIEAILAFPAGLFHGTRVPCCAWVLNRDPDRDTVLFVDARRMDLLGRQDSQTITELFCRYRAGESLPAESWYAAASISEIMEKDCILSPNLYTPPEVLSVPPLRQLSDRFRRAEEALCAILPSPALCQSIRQWETADPPRDWEELRLPELYTIAGGVCARKDAFGTEGVPMADVRTVIHHIFLPEKLPVRVQLSDGGRRSYDLRAGDILLNRTSETIEELACCCAVLKDCAAVYGAFLKRLRPCRAGRIDPRYAAAYFNSRIYRQEVRRVSVVYTTLASMNLQQLSEIRVYVPGAAWQAAFGRTLEDVIRFGQEQRGTVPDTVIDRFVDAFLEKFITYPIALFQKEREQR